MRTFKLQPSPYTDHLTEDGEELTKRPYPFLVQEDGTILNSEYLAGNPRRAIGFQADLHRQHIDLWFQDAVDQELTGVVGMYLVTRDEQCNLASQVHAISSIEILTNS